MPVAIKSLMWVFCAFLTLCFFQPTAGFSQSISAKPLLFVGPDEARPYIYTQEGKHVGIMADIIRELSALIGRPIDIKLLDFREARSMVEDGRADAVMPLSLTLKNMRRFEFPAPLFNISFTVFARQNEVYHAGWPNLKGVRIGVFEKGVSRSLAEEWYPNADLLPVQGSANAMALVQQSSIDAMITTRRTGNQAIYQNKISNVAALPISLSSPPAGLALRKGNYELFEILNPAIAQLHTDGTISQILSKWESSRVLLFTKKDVWIISGLTALAVTLTILIFGHFFLRQKKLSAMRLSQSEDRFKEIIEGTNDLVTVVDREGIFKFANHKAQSVFGLPAQECVGLLAFDFVHPDDRERTIQEFQGWVKNKKIPSTFENRQLSRDGAVHNMLWNITIHYDDDGEVETFSNIARDITAHKQAEDKVHQLAYTDPQSGMPNQAAFIEHLSNSLDQNQMGFVASIELSGIGDIIGTFGLEASELIYYELGNRISLQMNKESIAAKIGPRSFMVAYTPDNNNKEAMKEISTHIFHICEDSFDLMGAEVFVNVSMGVSFIDVQTSTVKTLLTDVEIAHHEAREAVSGSIVFFRNSIKENLIRTTKIVSWLHSAIENNVFLLYFQPQVNLKTNTIVGCEALIRWPVSTENWISPAEFIPIAEKAGLIGDITEWTVEEACRTAAAWNEGTGPKTRIGINISAEELASPHFLDYVTRFIDATNISPGVLEIEITETALMKDADVASKNLIKIRDMGASVAIDDFGTGQASLAYLKNFPIDRLKIDQSFVQGALTNNTDREIISSVVKLAHSLKMDVIAEGAEKKEHLDLLTALGCDEVQGYYIAKPMPAEQFVEFVSKYNQK
jgi:PAS domain S-box-containing protein